MTLRRRSAAGGMELVWWSQSDAMPPSSFAFPAAVCVSSVCVKTERKHRPGTEMSNMTSEQDSLWLVGVYSAAEVLTAVVACVGNGLVCWVFARTPVPWAPTHYFVASQAAADAGVGCLAVPFSVALGFQVELDRHVCRFLVVFILLLTQTSIFSLLAIAVDRSLFIRVPLRYSPHRRSLPEKGLRGPDRLRLRNFCQRTVDVIWSWGPYADLVRPSRVKVIIAALWLLSFFIILLPYLLWPGASPQHGAAATFGPCVFEEAMDMRFMVYCVFLGCVLPPLLLMLLLYSRIFAVARQHLEQEQRGRGDGALSLLSRELRAARPLAAAVGVSYVCWLPLHIRNGLTLLHPPLRAPNWLTLAAIALSHANSAFNPLLYALKLTEFRRALRTTLWPQKPWTRGDAALNSHHDCILATCAGSRNTLDTQGHGATHPSSA
ncbi:hypothetical protein Z043_102427 [Scleropages formosus]|uniref:G-protein coupled receptors family 1 profile domain-containing protein n=1 Tax=Scleropages formosus TaxID=113540 RepID=A0A0P7V7F1_SCLFO|nr:hypothetical protein Z043_102427 [Scleropages formosus]